MHGAIIMTLSKARLSSSSSSSSPPGAVLQKANALLHEEPFATVFHSIIWSILIVAATPIALLILQFRALYQLLSYFWNQGANERYAPQQRLEGDGLELAVVITGCDSGFGKEVAVLAAKEGFVVFAACLQESSLQQFKAVDNVIPVVMDVTKDRHVDELVLKVQEWLSTTGPAQGSRTVRRVLHALVNNAGIAHVGDIDWLSLETIQQAMDGEWLTKSVLAAIYIFVRAAFMLHRSFCSERCLSEHFMRGNSYSLRFLPPTVNFFGTVRCCKAFLPILKQQASYRSSSLGSSSHLPYHGSRILNVTSAAGLNANAPFVGVYCASKYAAQGFSEALRLELSVWNIQVATVNPTFHKTPICDDLATKLQQSWDQLPKAVQTQYGGGKHIKNVDPDSRFNGLFTTFFVALFLPIALLLEFIHQSTELTEQFVNRTLWEMSVVVGQIIKNLKAANIPAKILVGADARYVVMPLRMLPDWLVEGVIRLTMPNPKPLAMTKL